MDTESLRFLGTDLAIEEGTASLSTGADTPPLTNRYSVIYARQDGRWLHARIRDEPPDEVTPHEQLLELEWMLGEWVNESDDGIVQTTCTWSDDGNFLLREFDVKVEGRIALSGTQRIGWDAQRKQFRMWVFDDGAGSPRGCLHTTAIAGSSRASGVRSDGQSVSVTNAITPLDKDRIRWETSSGRSAARRCPDTDQFTWSADRPTRRSKTSWKPSSAVPRHSPRLPGGELMLPRLGKRLLIFALAFAFVTSAAIAQRGGRGGGGGGAAAAVVAAAAAAVVAGCRGGGGGGCRAAAGGGGASRSPGVSSPTAGPEAR